MSSECHGSGRPMRSLVTIGGEPGFIVAEATNSSVTSTKPATARKARAGIAAFRLQHPQHSGQQLSWAVAVDRVGPWAYVFEPVAKGKIDKKVIGWGVTNISQCRTL